MGSCFSAESRSPRPGSPSSPNQLYGRRKSSKKRRGSHNSSFDYRKDERLRKIPGRMFLNGSSEIASLFTQQGKKGTNQDAMIVWENFASKRDTVFCGVFDGHGPYGHMVARRVRDYLPLKLKAHLELNVSNEGVIKEINVKAADAGNSEDTPFISADEESRPSVDLEDVDKQPDMFETLKDSFLKAFRVTDRELRMHRTIDSFCSGTTAVTLVKQGRDIVIGNVGDSRAVLGTRDKDDTLIAVQLTVDLKPNLPEEAERIRKCKGRVFALKDEPEVARVWLPNNDSPGLAMARAFGDFCLKEFGLISVPEISCRRLTEKDEFIVLATDGVWDVLSNKEVVQIVASAPARSSAAQVLVQSAVRAWKCKYPTSKIDDCAVVCLFLDSEQDNSSTHSFIKAKDKSALEERVTVDSEKGDLLEPAGLGRSGTVRMGGDDTNPDGSNEGDFFEVEEMQLETGTDWSALEGVSRVDTLTNLPRFEPEKEKGI